MRKNKKVIIFFATILFLSIASFSYVFAGESLFLNLKIKEDKINYIIKFSLQEAGFVYGDYGTSLNIFDESNPNKSDYILEFYDKGKKEMLKYSLFSSRFTFYDAGESGGVIETNSGVINIIVPYDRNNPASFFRINNNGIKTDYIPLPQDVLEKKLTEVNFCKNENESGKYIVDKCCSGLIPATQEDGSFVCVNCGDKICSEFEDYKSCFEDCPVEQNFSRGSSLLKFFGNIKNIIYLAIIFVALFFLILLIKLIIKMRKYS